VIWVRETARATAIKSRPVLLIVCEDITEGKRAAEALREVQVELTHASRVVALGQLTASIAHEVNQPIAAVVASGHAALRWLDKADLEKVRRAIERVTRDATRAGDVLSRLRAFFKKAPPRTESFDMNEAICDVIVVTDGEAAKGGIAVETQLAPGLPLIQGDRVQVQQVILNLILNAIEAMSGVGEGRRELLIKTARFEADFVSVVVQDSGPGLDPAHANRAFEASTRRSLTAWESACRSAARSSKRTEENWR
jgi:C4-dicarboxylate-specific signal transduction histidine kinase